MGDPLPYAHLHAAGGDEDHSIHTESVSPPINAHGRGASLSDAADRGAKRSPMTEAMPTQSSGELERGAWDK